MLTTEAARIVLLIALGVIMIGLFAKRFKPTAIFGSVVLVLSILGIIPLSELFEHMANPSIVTIFLLIFITASLKEHFNLMGLVDVFFHKIKHPRIFLVAFTPLVSLLSSVVNNTPIVALFIPYIYEWSKKRNVSPSKYLIPLSFAATLGGTITLIGTSTNLVLNGLMISNGFEAFGFTDFLIPGLLVTVGGLIYLVTVGYHLLPEHKSMLEDLNQDQRNYIVETLVAAQSGLINKTVKEGGLRSLNGLYLVEINREGKVISPVRPDQILLAGDLLYFAGETSKVTELVKTERYGLVFPKTEKYNLGNKLDLVETLVPAMSNLGGKRVKETNFRDRYDAAIVAIKRDGHQLGGKIGDQTLAYGDMLLLTAGSSFREKIRGAKNLYNISYIDSIGQSHKKEKRIFGLVALFVISAWVFSLIDLLMGLVILQVALFALKLANFDQLKRQFNPDLFLILVFAIAFGSALINTGTAGWLTEILLGKIVGQSPTTLLLVLFLITVLLTSFVTNVAAVAIIFPVAAVLIPEIGLPAKDVFLTIAFAASCSFLTPISYQTNLMVYEPGGYKASDFLRVGLPLTILYALICIAYFG